jgi:hypothetical protein
MAKLIVNMKKFSKIFYAFWTIAFLLFSYWQFNDPDPWIWVLVYWIAAGFTILGYKEIFPLVPLGIAIVTCGIFAIVLFPTSVTDWIQFEMEQKDLSMKTQSSEEARETFGLLTVALIMSIAFIQGWKKKTI